MLMGILAFAGYSALIFTYLSLRPKGVISAMDLFVALLSIQFGPHSIIPHPFLEAALLVPGTYPAYAAGLAVAYFGLAAGLGGAGIILNTRGLKMLPPPSADLTARAVPLLIIVTIAYVGFFVAVQGFNLSRTLNYLNFFRGESLYTYTQLRREMYEDDAVLGITAITRQSTSAILYATLIYAAIKFKAYRLTLVALAAMLFIVCCLQMNKFPILYYTVVTGLVIFFTRAYKTGQFLSPKLVGRLLLALGAFSLVLYGLYNIQYADSIKQGLVQNDRVIFRVITRPFSANHDALYLWFAHIPDTIGFVGFGNVTPIAKAFNLEYHSPMVEIPALYTRVATTYQAGFIGSSYASFGYPGIFVGGLFVGALVAAITLQQAKLKQRWQVIVYGAVAGMNFYFLDSRELHTALLSGGIAAVPILFALISLATQARPSVAAARYARQSR